MYAAGNAGVHLQCKLRYRDLLLKRRAQLQPAAWLCTKCDKR
jgi:hypothetical protein